VGTAVCPSAIRTPRTAMMLVDECERIQPATISPASQKGRPNPLGNERTLIIMSAKAYGQTESSFAILLLVRRGLPKRRLVEGAQLAAVQARAFLAQVAHGGDADLQVRGYGFLVEGVRLLGQLDLAMQRLVADT